MYHMYLYIFFTNKRVEKHLIKRFSDLSQTKSKYYYYEETYDERGKGKCFLREEIICFEVSPYELPQYEKYLETKEER